MFFFRAEVLHEKWLYPTEVGGEQSTGQQCLVISQTRQVLSEMVGWQLTHPPQLLPFSGTVSNTAMSHYHGMPVPAPVLVLPDQTQATEVIGHET